jgi:hypothetical protein
MDRFYAIHFQNEESDCPTVIFKDGRDPYGHLPQFFFFFFNSLYFICKENSN